MNLTQLRPFVTPDTASERFAEQAVKFALATVLILSFIQLPYIGILPPNSIIGGILLFALTLPILQSIVSRRFVYNNILVITTIIITIIISALFYVGIDTITETWSIPGLTNLFCLIAIWNISVSLKWRSTP